MGVITGATGSRPLMHDLTARFTAAPDQSHRDRDADPLIAPFNDDAMHRDQKRRAVRA
jgi:hypothetical protein